MNTKHDMALWLEQARVNKLKSDWLDDPCWDIETTKGFEKHRDELLKFRLEKQAQWAREHEQRLLKKAEELGVPGNLKLAAYVIALENKIEDIDRAVYRALNPNP